MKLLSRLFLPYLDVECLVKVLAASRFKFKEEDIGL